MLFQNELEKSHVEQSVAHMLSESFETYVLTTKNTTNHSGNADWALNTRVGTPKQPSTYNTGAA